MKKHRIVSIILTLILVLSPVATLANDGDGPTGEEGGLPAGETIEETVEEDEQTPDPEDGMDAAEAPEEEDVNGGTEGGIAEESSDTEEPEESGAEEEKPAAPGPLRAHATETPAADQWTADDFTYEYKSKLMYGCDYTRQLYVSGQVITGFSDSGFEKLDPVYDTESGDIMRQGFSLRIA